MTIYKACDIRGVYGEDLTEEIALRIGKAVGTKLITRYGLPVTSVVGGDVRPSTKTLKKALIEGLVATGCQVTDIGTVPTPAFYFARNHLRAKGGVMVTASHNPPEFNGFKLVLGEMPIAPEDIEEIKNIVESEKFNVEGEKIKREDVREVEVIESYLNFIKEVGRTFSCEKVLKVVIDAGNGCMSRIAPRVFRDFGHEVKELYCREDGTFPNRHPNPVLEESLRGLSKKVIEEEADLGIGFDGDGDRVVFMDETGKVVEGDQAIVIFVRDILSRKLSAGNHPSKVVYDIKCSSIVPETIEKWGGIPLPQRSGHAFLKRGLLKERAVFGGEISGHFFFGELSGDDSLYAALYLTKIITAGGKSLRELASEVPAYFTTPDIRVPFEGKGKEVLLKIEEGLSSYQVDTLDGVRVQFPRGWGLGRVSVTEPLLTFRFEAESKEGLKEVMDLFLSPVPEIKEKVQCLYQP
ncbi:MAG: phosphomannomutase/phosphoglucomutase [Nitrospirae bacterium]|nr:phosphomannomutase/phosphoglucomutase [Nitrospirota bacterium]